MNSHQPTPDVQPSRDLNALNDRIMKTLERHRWKGRLITGSVLFFSVFSLIFTFMVFLMAYFSERNFHYNISNNVPGADLGRFYLLYGPDHFVYAQGHRILPDGTAEAKPTYAEMSSILQYQLRADMEFSFHTHMINTIGIAMSLLGLSSLAALLLAIFNRRIALRQINESLAQISAQLHEMQHGPPRDAA